MALLRSFLQYACHCRCVLCVLGPHHCPDCERRHGERR